MQAGSVWAGNEGAGLYAPCRVPAVGDGQRGHDEGVDQGEDHHLRQQFKTPLRLNTTTFC